jgi:hypothetical protein
VPGPVPGPVPTEIEMTPLPNNQEEIVCFSSLSKPVVEEPQTNPIKIPNREDIVSFSNPSKPIATQPKPVIKESTMQPLLPSQIKPVGDFSRPFSRVEYPQVTSRIL